MKSNVRIMIMTAAVVVLAGLIYRIETVPVPEVQAPQAPVDHKTIVDIHDNVKIQAKYPVLGQTVADKDIADWANGAVTNFENEIANPPPLPPGAPDWQNELRIEYTTSNFSRSIESVRFEVLTFTGGAHPNHETVTKTFDLTSGRELALSDVFKPDSDYLNKLAGMAYDDLKGSLVDPVDSMLQEGTAATPDNYKDFTLNEEGITLIFDPYQVAPYSYGTQEVHLDWSRVQDLVYPQFVPEFK